MNRTKSHPPWQKYRIIRVLGQGSQGKVREAIHIPTGTKVAIKTIRKDGFGARAAVGAETEALRGLRHPHIITLFEVFETERSFCLVFELAEGGTLFERIVELKSFTEEDAAVILATVLNALVFLHRRHLCHRDLKPPNLQFKTMDVDAPLLILDFGIAKSHNSRSGAMKTQIGSPLFMAPEILRNSGDGYGKEVDLFAVGVVTFQMLTGVHPSHGYSDQADLFRHTLEGDYDFSDETWDGIGPKARDFCRRLLEPDPKKRMKASEAMEHPWILKYCPPEYLADLKQVNVEAEEDSAPLASPTTPTPSPTELSPPDRALQRTRTFESIPGVLSVSSKYILDLRERLPNLLYAEQAARTRLRGIVKALGIAGYLSKPANVTEKVNEGEKSASKDEPAENGSEKDVKRSLAIKISNPEPVSLVAPPDFPESELNLVDWDTDTDDVVTETKTSASKSFMVEIENDRSMEEMIEDAFGY
jgi:serine/threonine protein kinase